MARARARRKAPMRSMSENRAVAHCGLGGRRAAACFARSAASVRGRGAAGACRAAIARHRTPWSRAGGPVHAAAVQAILGQATGSFGVPKAFAMPVALCLRFLAACHFTGMSTPPLRGEIVLFLHTVIYPFHLASRACGAAIPTGGAADAAPADPTGDPRQGWRALEPSCRAGPTWRRSSPPRPCCAAGWRRPIRSASRRLARLFGVGSGTVMSGAARHAGGAQPMGMLWRRAVFLTSWIFFLAPVAPGWMLQCVGWNPVFHPIDRLHAATFAKHAGGAGRKLCRPPPARFCVTAIRSLCGDARADPARPAPRP
jgi:hypothetical protein